MTKHTARPNDRPTGATPLQSGPGLPDHTGSTFEPSDEEIARVRSKLKEGDRLDEKEDLEQQLERPKHGTA